MMEVVADSQAPFVLILDGTNASGVYEGRSGKRYGQEATTLNTA